MFELNIIFWTVYYLRAYSYRKQKTQNTELRNYTETVSKHYFYYTQFIKFILYRSGILTKKWFQVGFEMRNEYNFDSKICFSREAHFDYRKKGKFSEKIQIFGSFWPKIQNDWRFFIVISNFWKFLNENPKWLMIFYRKCKISGSFWPKILNDWRFLIVNSKFLDVFDEKS